MCGKAGNYIRIVDFQTVRGLMGNRFHASVGWDIYLAGTKPFPTEQSTLVPDLYIPYMVLPTEHRGEVKQGGRSSL